MKHMLIRLVKIKQLNSTNQLSLACEHARAEDALKAAPPAHGLGAP